MQVGTTTSTSNPNAFWLNSRGMWAGYLVTVVVLHGLIMGVPFISTGMAWTLTHVIHNLVRASIPLHANKAAVHRIYVIIMRCSAVSKWWVLIRMPPPQGMYVMFHAIKGTLYATGDQDDARRLTNWEQIDDGEQYTATRKFLIAVPIVLYV